MSVIGAKRFHEATNDVFQANKRRKIDNTAHLTDAVVSVFQIPELVENIIKYSLKNPETIVHISRTSKMHYNLVHCGSMWVRFGFSDELIQAEKLPSSELRLMLAQLCSENYNEQLKELQMRANVVQRICNRVPRPRSVDLAPQELRQFNVNYYLTKEAAIALLRIIKRTYIRYFSLRELVQWLEQDSDRYANNVGGIIEKHFEFPIDEGTTISRVVTLDYSGRYVDEKPEDILDLLHASQTDEYYGFDGWIQKVKLANPKKTLLFIYSYYEHCKHYISFIKLDRSTNKIECCGDLLLYVQKKFYANAMKALNYLCEFEQSDNYWQNLEFYDVLKSSLQYRTLASDEKYTKLVAEDVTFVR